MHSFGDRLLVTETDCHFCPGANHCQGQLQTPQSVTIPAASKSSLCPVLEKYKKHYDDNKCVVTKLTQIQMLENTESILLSMPILLNIQHFECEVRRGI